MSNILYIKVDWPESHPILDWKAEFHDQVYPIDNFGYMVPVELWESYKKNPDSFIMGTRK